MAEELQSAAKIIEVGLQAVRLAGGAGAKFIQYMIAQKQLKEKDFELKEHEHIVNNGGEVSYFNLLKHGSGDTVMIDVATEDANTLDTLYANMQKSKMLFTRVEDLNLGDGHTQFLIDAKDANTFSVLMQRMSDLKWKTTTHEEYMANDPEGRGKKLVEEAREKVIAEGRDEIPESMAENMKQAEDILKTYRDDENLLEISIDKESLVDKSRAKIESLDLSEDQFACKIPGTYGDNERFLVIPDTHVFEVSGEEKERFVAFIGKDDMPDILSLESNKDLLENDVINYIPDENFAQSGEDLIKKSFDAQNVKKGNTELNGGIPKFKLVSDKRKERGDKVLTLSESKLFKEKLRREDVYERTKALEGTKEIRLDRGDILSEMENSYCFFTPGRPDSCFVIPKDFVKEPGYGKHLSALIPKDKEFPVIDLNVLTKAVRTNGINAPASAWVQHMTMLKGNRIAKEIASGQAKLSSIQGKAEAFAQKQPPAAVTKAIAEAMRELEKVSSPEHGGR